MSTRRITVDSILDGEGGCLICHEPMDVFQKLLDGNAAEWIPYFHMWIKHNPYPRPDSPSYHTTDDVLTHSYKARVLR